MDENFVDRDASRAGEAAIAFFGIDGTHFGHGLVHEIGDLEGRDAGLYEVLEAGEALDEHLARLFHEADFGL